MAIKDGQEVWWLRLADNRRQWAVHGFTATVTHQWDGAVALATYLGVRGYVYRTVPAEWVFATREEARAEAKRRNGGEE